MLELLLRIKTINVNILLIKSKMSIFGYTCDSVVEKGRMVTKRLTKIEQLFGRSLKKKCGHVIIQ